MINNKTFIVFDFETDDKNPKTCNPIQIAALAVHPRKLEIIPDSEFVSWCKPDGFDDPDYYNKHQDTIDWHAKNHNIKPEEFLAIIGAAPPEKIVWSNFMTYLKTYYESDKKKSVYGAPILTGYNIFEFDKIIFDRMCSKYKNVNKDDSPNVYNKRDTVDIMKMLFPWFESLTMIQNYSMDHMREVFGLTSDGVAHEGLKDCKDEAALFIRLMNLHRAFAAKVKEWH